MLYPYNHSDFYFQYSTQYIIWGIQPYYKIDFVLDAFAQPRLMCKYYKHVWGRLG